MPDCSTQERGRSREKWGERYVHARRCSVQARSVPEVRVGVTLHERKCLYIHTMRNISRFLVMFSLLALVSTCEAQVTVYRTFADWKGQKAGIPYKSYRGTGHALGKPFSMFETEGGKRVKEKEVWGFISGEYLFRLAEKDEKTARVIVNDINGSICLWHFAGADMKAEGEQEVTDYLLYLSEGMNGRIVPTPHGLKNSSVTIPDYSRFMKKGKETGYREFCECLERSNERKTAFECVEQYNKQHPSEEK